MGITPDFLKEKEQQHFGMRTEGELSEVPRKLLEGGFLGASCIQQDSRDLGDLSHMQGFLLLVSTKDREGLQSFCGPGLFWTIYKLLWHIKRGYFNT